MVMHTYNYFKTRKKELPRRNLLLFNIINENHIVITYVPDIPITFIDLKCTDETTRDGNDDTHESKRSKVRHKLHSNSHNDGKKDNQGRAVNTEVIPRIVMNVTKIRQLGRHVFL